MVLFFHCFPRACDVLGRLQVRKHWSVCGCSKSEAVPEVSGRPNVSKVGYQFCLKNGARGLHRWGVPWGEFCFQMLWIANDRKPI